MKKGEEIKDKTRNNRFVEAFDYLRRNCGDINRIQLAAKMGVSKDTITRIMHAYTPFTDDAITKFQTATGCIFNLQWLRGESDTMLANDAEKESAPAAETPHYSAPTIDQGSLMNAAIAAQQTAIESLKRELAEKEESTRRELAAKEEAISALRGQLATKGAQLRDKDATIASKEAVIATKDAQLADKDAHIATLKQQVADLRAALASQKAKDTSVKYPFPVGVADNGNHQQPKK